MATLPPASDIKALLALSAERDAWGTVALAREREGYDRGYSDGHADGWRAGYEARYAELERAWHEVARRVARGGPSFAELERRRWGPGGREHFGDPQPDDFPGRGEAA